MEVVAGRPGLDPSSMGMLQPDGHRPPIVPVLDWLALALRGSTIPAKNQKMLDYQ